MTRDLWLWLSVGGAIAITVGGAMALLGAYLECI
jgi:hypothetical protein